MSTVIALNLSQPSVVILTPQLPIAWYASAEFYALEQQHLFPKVAQYIGHELMLPNIGDYYTLDWMGDAKALIRDADGISLMSNVCRHRQAIMLKGAGNLGATAQNIVCPLHRWTYTTKGELLGAPHFAQNPCLHLETKPLINWQGLLFNQVDHPKFDIAKTLSTLGVAADFDFTNYHLDKVNIEHYSFNWKTFIEVYLEDYHVDPFHPGLNQFVDCTDLTWDFGDHFSVQTVGYKATPKQPASTAYQHWQTQVTQYHAGKTPKQGAIWMVLYPFLMIEWYPNVLVVSHLVPTGVDSCTNVVEFYYPEDIALFEREYVAAQQAAYAETAIEDKEICQRMHDGRKALFAQGLDQRGPYQHPMETGLAHFNQWYREQMESHLPQFISDSQLSANQTS